MSPAKILVTRGDDSFTAELRSAGLHVRTLPLIEIVPEADLSSLKTELARLDEYDGLFFTSPHAVDAVMQAGESELLGYHGKIYIVGERARSILERSGIKTAGDAADSAEGLLESIMPGELSGKRFLYFCGDRSLRKITEGLDGVADVRELVVYRTVDRAPSDEAARDVSNAVAGGEIDWVCFFSPSASEAFRRFIPARPDGNLKAAAIGATTATRARELGFRVEFISAKPSPHEFAQGLISKINGS